jgi:hypothetical protein
MGDGGGDCTLRTIRFAIFEEIGGRNNLCDLSEIKGKADRKEQS